MTTTRSLTLHRTPARPSLRSRRVGALAALALSVATLGSACSASGPEKIAAPTTKAPVTAVASTNTDAPTTTAAPTGADPQVAATSMVVRSDHDIALHDGPEGATTKTLAATTEFGSPVSLLVTEAQPGWVKVLVPGRPTGATAWVNADDVELRQVTTLVHVDLAARTLTLYDAGQVVLTTPVAVGSPEAPTPTGTFSVTDKLQTPNAGGAYGPYAFGLSGRSEVLTEFAGGDGQIGIHGTNDPASIGNNVSHGCIRVPNDVIEHLEQILPLGTPVVVS